MVAATHIPNAVGGPQRKITESVPRVARRCQRWLPCPVAHGPVSPGSHTHRLRRPESSTWTNWDRSAAVHTATPLIESHQWNIPWAFTAQGVRHPRHPHRTVPPGGQLLPAAAVRDKVSVSLNAGSGAQPDPVRRPQQRPGSVSQPLGMMIQRHRYCGCVKKKKIMGGDVR
jgi:hypothetical protein